MHPGKNSRHSKRTQIIQILAYHCISCVALCQGNIHKRDEPQFHHRVDRGQKH